MFLKSEKGLSLVELMIAVGLGGFVTVMALSALVSMSNQSSNLQHTMSSDIEEQRATSVVTAMLAQAIEIKDAGNTTLNNFVSPDGTGRIRQYDSNAFWGDPIQTQTLAVFWREAGNSVDSSPAAVASQFLATGIFFQRPTQTTYGVLYINTGANPASLAPSRSDLMFEGLTRVRVMNITTYQDDPLAPIPLAPVTGFDLELTFRHFLGGQGDRLEDRTYCPDALAAASVCLSPRAHKDVTSIYHITVRNTVLYRSLSGSRAARLFDQLHFFAPRIPGGI